MAKKTNAKNSNLLKAKAAKNDEFYTQISDIENEMNAYYEHNPNVFRGKTILCPCDDPEWSNFTKHFTQNFVRYGLKKLICTCYNKEEGGHGKMLVLTGDTNGNGKIEEDDIVATEMEGNGDFRSEEVKKLLNETDFVITNPPFSLFLEFMALLVQGQKKFSIIGNMNSVSCKEVFPLIKDNKVWLGASPRSMDFKRPDGKIESVNAIWFTNIEHNKRHEPQDLCTKAQLKKRGVDFKRYVNYNAIEVPRGEWIPKDHKGVMGVPITWLDKYCPEQFEILGSSLQLAKPIAKCVEPDAEYEKGGSACYIKVGEKQYRRLYPRVLIKHKS